MTINLNRAEQSRLFLNTLRSLECDPKDTNPETVKRQAYAELVSRTGLLCQDAPSWFLLAAAEALSEHVYEQTGNDVAEIDVQALAEALGVERRIAVLVARLGCGCCARQRNGTHIFANADSAPRVTFPQNMLEGFLQNLDY